MGDNTASAPTVALSSLVSTDRTLQELRATRTETTGGLVSALLLDGRELPFDVTDGCWLCATPAERTDWDPPVRWVADKDVQLAAARPRAQEVELVAYTPTTWRSYRLALTTLPVLDIALSAGTDPGTLTREAAPMELALFDPGDFATPTVSQGTIHVRGQTSAAYPKKGFRISLTKGAPSAGPTGSSGTDPAPAKKNKLSLLGLRKDDDWVLVTVYSDHEKVRNVLSSNLWYHTCAGHNALGVRAGVEHRLVEVVLGGRYWGLYALCYPVDAKQLGTHAAGEWLFKKSYTTASERWPWLLSSGDTSARGGYELAGGDECPQAWDALRTLFGRMLCNPLRLRSIADYDNAVDLWLFFALTAAVDNAGGRWAMKNLYVALRNDGRGRSVALYVPWDLDQTWGSQWDGRARNNVRMHAVPHSSGVREFPGTVSRLRETGDATVRDELRARWWELRQDAWSDGEIARCIDELETQVFDSGAFARERARWPQGTYVHEDARLSGLRAWAQARLAYLDGVFG